jgi:hypothetical protein
VASDVLCALLEDRVDRPPSRFRRLRPGQGHCSGAVPHGPLDPVPSMGRGDSADQAPRDDPRAHSGSSFLDLFDRM